VLTKKHVIIENDIFMKQQIQKENIESIDDESSCTSLTKTNDILKKLQSRIGELEEQQSARDRTISWNSADISQKTRTIAKLQTLLATQKQDLMQKDQEIAKKDHDIVNRDQHIGSLEQHITAIEQSKSFKIGRAVTYPLRLCRRLLHPPPPTPDISTVSATEQNATEQNAIVVDSAKSKKESPQTSGVIINLEDQLLSFFGKHRHGWSYAVMHLAPLNHSDGIFCDTFIERTFVWTPGKIKPTLRPWIGFIHIPPNMPDWFYSNQTNDEIFATDAWKKSYPYCKGLFTLSQYHKKNLQKKLDIPINALLLPTGISPVTWKWELFEQNTNRKIVQVGWWLRKLHAIFELPESDYEKIFLNVGSDPYFNTIFAMERERRTAKGLFRESMYNSAATVDYLPDTEYDKLLSENIMFVELYDSSANNLIIECIVRNTPLLVNPLEPVVEYLGPDYPFYFSNHEEAVYKANDLDLVRKTHEYLKQLPIKEKLTGDYFLESFQNAEIFKQF